MKTIYRLYEKFKEYSHWKTGCHKNKLRLWVCQMGTYSYKRFQIIAVVCIITVLAAVPSCAAQQTNKIASPQASSTPVAAGESTVVTDNESETFEKKLVDAAMGRLRADVQYDPTYYRIPYPGGDVPADRGVCTDVVIRSYRKIGIDLQKNVHEDMKANFEKYPKKWGLTKTDSNIDHRRVPNLQTFFKRKGTSLTITNNPKDYLPGDLVTWNLPGNLPHIGIIVSEFANEQAGRRMIVHNIGSGPELEDVLFSWKITGHFRYQPK